MRERERETSGRTVRNLATEKEGREITAKRRAHEAVAELVLGEGAGDSERAEGHQEGARDHGAHDLLDDASARKAAREERERERGKR